jgi:catechol 2,3-dioxygenase-like lactoylglutathione lyase family enzyme
MLADSPAIATLGVKDLARAKAFYQDELGLKFLDERPGVMTFEAGGQQIFVYQTSFAGTNQATGATWKLDDVDAAVADLKSRGVVFEHYDNVPELKQVGDVYKGHGMTVCWLKDPDGNILSLVGES